MRKGNVVDLIYVGAVMVMVLMMAVVGVAMMNKIWDSETFQDSSPKADNFETMKNNVTDVYDWAFPSAGMLAFVGVIAFAWMTPTHPIFVLFSFGLLIVGSIIIPTLANAYLDLASSSSLSTASAELSLTQTYVENYPIIFIIMGCIMLWSMYASSQRY